MEQELHTLYLNPGPYYSISNCLCIVLHSIICPVVLFLLAIALSVLSRFMVSVYSFGIFKLFLISFGR